MAINRLILIYDGNCSLCRKSIDWIQKREVGDVIEYLPCQSKERKTRFPEMTEETCLSAIQLILPDGRVLSGEKAFPEIFKYLRGWRYLAFFFRIPGVNLLSPVVYRWIANHRYTISYLLKLP